MANIKIAQLTNATTISDTDIVLIEDATQTKKMTVATLKNLLGIQYGGVEDSGDTPDGSYIKFKDGTMICSGTETTINLIFPLEFIAPPKVFLTPVISVAGIVIATPMNITKSGCNVYKVYWTGTTFDTAGESANYLAIGRWKV